MALDLKFDGLMIETHINPDYAWSDAAQQVSPDQLRAILNRLIIKREQPEGVELNSIEDLRSSIEYIDHQLIDLLSYRMKIVEDIATVKKKHNMTILQEDRWRHLSGRHIEKAGLSNLDVQFINELFKLIHLASIDRQNDIINNE